MKVDEVLGLKHITVSSGHVWECVPEQGESEEKVSQREVGSSLERRWCSMRGRYVVEW